MNRGRRGVAAALLTGVALAGCTEVSTVPQVPVSLQFDSLPALAVVVGDTLRGDSLRPARVPVRAFDGSGRAVSDSLLAIIGIDTASVRAFSLIPGFRIVGVREASAVRIVAQAGALQSQTQTFAVVPAPTAIVKSTTVNDSIVYDRPDTSLRSTDIGVNVIRQVPDSTAVTLNGLRVRFTVDSFSRAILDSVRLVGTAVPRRNTTSAIVTGGAATVGVKVYTRPNASGNGVVRVLVSHVTRGVATPGSPFAIVVRLVPFGSSAGRVTTEPPPLAPARALP